MLSNLKYFVSRVANYVSLTFDLKLKGVSICFGMLKAVLSGSYVNFGVFQLYGDSSLEEVLQMFVKLLLSIPLSDLLVSSIPTGPGKKQIFGQDLQYTGLPLCGVSLPSAL